MKNAKRRSVWKFVCRSCGTESHVTLIRKRAVKGLCLRCKKIDPRQITFAGFPSLYSGVSQKVGNLQGNKIAGKMKRKHISL